MEEKKKLLLIEDDEHILELLKYNLETRHYEICIARDGDEGIRLARAEKPDLIILDLMLPKVDGLDVCRVVRKDDQVADTPIIMLTAKGSEMDKITGLELGADDYITKPFSIRELMTRIKVVLRRYEKTTTTTSEEKKLQIDRLVMDLDKHEVTIEDVPVHLTFKEFELLRKLMENRNKVLARDLLLDEIWGYDYYGDTRTVDVHIRHLRSKIGEMAGLIQTVRGVGYKMVGSK
jgi:two-component system alkaline phosphatase synthesis response regulator PhoP